MTDADIDVSMLTPAQAAEKLAEMTVAYRGTPSEDAAAKLERFTQDRGKGQKLQAGDVETRREFDELVKAAADANPIEAAMTGKLPELPTGEQVLMKNTAGMLKEFGIRDEVIRETLSGQPVTQAEHDATKIWRDQHLADKEYVKKWLNGDIEARKEMMLASIILSSKIRGKAT